MSRHMVLAEDLNESVLTQAKSIGRVGVDVETSGLDLFNDTLLLVQVALEGTPVILVRSTPWRRAEKLLELLYEPRIMKIFQYAAFDCAFLWRHFGRLPINIGCTKVASKILDPATDKHTLQYLLARYVGVSIDKSHAHTDWSGDLTTDQMLGAASDARWLVPLMKRMEEELNTAPPFPSGTNRAELNRRCQEFLPTVIELRMNRLLPDRRDTSAVFDY